MYWEFWVTTQEFFHDTFSEPKQVIISAKNSQISIWRICRDVTDRKRLNSTRLSNWCITKVTWPSRLIIHSELQFAAILASCKKIKIKIIIHLSAISIALSWSAGRAGSIFLKSAFQKGFTRSSRRLNFGDHGVEVSVLGRTLGAHWASDYTRIPGVSRKEGEV